MQAKNTRFWDQVGVTANQGQSQPQRREQMSNQWSMVAIQTCHKGHQYSCITGCPTCESQQQDYFPCPHEFEPSEFGINLCIKCGVSEPQQDARCSICGGSTFSSQFGLCTCLNNRLPEQQQVAPIPFRPKAYTYPCHGSGFFGYYAVTEMDKYCAGLEAALTQAREALTLVRKILVSDPTRTYETYGIIDAALAATQNIIKENKNENTATSINDSDIRDK